jgi:hypothetical protein
MTIFVTASSEPMYEAQEFATSPGLYYDPLGKAVFYENEWRLVVYLDIPHYTLKLRSVEKSLKMLKELCKTVNCKTFDTLQHSVVSLKNKASTFINLIESKNSNRVRRGWFDGIGTVLKVITGVPDHDDVNKIDDDINNLNNDNRHLLDLMKEQTSIVKTTIINFNQTLHKLNINEKLFNRNTELYNTFIQNMTIRINRHEDLIFIEEHIQTLHILVIDLHQEYDSLINAIMFAQRNQIHPSIIDPDTFIVELTKTLPHLPGSNYYPVSLTKENANILLTLVKLSVYFYKDKLTYNIKIPLINHETFNLYRMLPLPISLEPKNYFFIQPNTKYLIISENKNHYVYLNSLDDCKMLFGNNYICKQTITFSAHSRPSCETELLSAMMTNVPKTCDTRFIHGHFDTWYKLGKKNTWLYVLSSPQTITITCKGQQQPTDVILVRSGTFSLSSTCKAYTLSAILSPEQIFSSNYTKPFPKVNIIEDDCCKDNISQPLHFSLPPIHVSNLDLGDLGVLSHKINQFDEKLKVEYNRGREVIYTTTYLSTIIILSLIITSCVCARRCTKGRLSRRCPPASICFHVNNLCGINRATSIESIELDHAVNIGNEVSSEASSIECYIVTLCDLLSGCNLT